MVLASGNVIKMLKIIEIIRNLPILIITIIFIFLFIFCFAKKVKGIYFYLFEFFLKKAMQREENFLLIVQCVCVGGGSFCREKWSFLNYRFVFCWEFLVLSGLSM